MTKICSKCKRELDISYFSKDKRSKDGYKCTCKECIRKYYVNNKDRILKKQKEYWKDNKEKIKECNKKYYIKNKNRILKKQKIYSKEYYNSHKEERLEHNREYFKKGYKLNAKSKKTRNERERNNRKNNINSRIRTTIRNRIYVAVKRKDNSSIDYLGCTMDFYINYLSSLFIEGMSWNNYGEWQIDHIIPVASFDLTKEENIYKCFNYKNTQPLWKKDNLKKGDKLPWNS